MVPVRLKSPSTLFLDTMIMGDFGCSLVLYELTGGGFESIRERNTEEWQSDEASSLRPGSYRPCLQCIVSLAFSIFGANLNTVIHLLILLLLASDSLIKYGEVSFEVGGDVPSWSHDGKTPTKAYP